MAVESLGYDRDAPRNGLDSALNAQAVTALYMRTFGSVEVSVRVRARGELTPILACNLGQALASSVPMARAMQRGLSEDACDPHFVLSLTADAAIPDTADSEALLRVVRSGSRMSAIQKARLMSLPDLRQRAAWSVAWVAERCRRSMSAARHATLPVSYRPLSSGAGGALHSNLIAMRTDSDGTTHLELFEPNGVDAYRAEGLADIIDGIEHELSKWNLLPNGCTFQAVGTGIQTALGEWRFSSEGSGWKLQAQGYPVCGAVCVWAFAGYLSSNYQTLREFDAALHAQLKSSPGERHKLQRQFSAFLTSLAEWNDTEGKGALREALLSNLRGTNVVSLSVARGGRWKCAVTVPPS